MNPRYRRLLIPGLLIALLVIVVISSLVRRADAAESGPVVVSRMADARITESSGLAVSRTTDDLAYTINDSGNAPVIYAIRISTGAVVGTTTVAGGSLVDTEAMAIDGDGTIWIADTGDNDEKRTDVALYALPEPGAGVHSVTARRYPLRYDTGPVDVEALVIDPRTGAKTLITKELLGGRVMTLPKDLSTDRTNEATAGDESMPLLVTDAAATTDSRYALVRTYTSVSLYDTRTWKLVRSSAAPSQPQGETIAVERGGRSFLLGSEGADSALLRLPLTLPTGATPTTTSPSPTPDEGQETGTSVPPDGNGFAGEAWLGAGLVMVLLAGISVLATRRSRTR